MEARSLLTRPDLQAFHGTIRPLAWTLTALTNALTTFWTLTRIGGNLRSLATREGGCSFPNRASLRTLLRQRVKSVMGWCLRRLGLDITSFHSFRRVYETLLVGKLSFHLRFTGGWSTNSHSLVLSYLGLL